MCAFRFRYINFEMYTFGAPRVGCDVFNVLFGRYIKKAFRIVYEGDVIVGLPPRSLGSAVGIGM